MTTYTDAFGKPLNKDDVRLAVQATVMSSTVSTMSLNRSTRLGMVKVVNILRLLEAANIVSPAKDGKRQVIMRGFNNHAAAVNAALRQLKKGRK